MLKLFKKKPKAVSLRVIKLCQDGYCAVVGESHYQDALRATSTICATGPEGRRTFTAVLVAEPQNRYDANAIAIYSPQGRLGYLSREDAIEYHPVLEEVVRLGYDGGACEAHLTGGEPGKPSFGVVLRLADPFECLAGLRDDDADDDQDEEDRSGPGFVRGRHYTDYVDHVKELRRSGREVEAEELLLELVDAIEAEAGVQGRGVAPWYYEQLAVSYRKCKDIPSEIAILERFARQQHSPGASPPQLLERLAKARALAQRG